MEKLRKLDIKADVWCATIRGTVLSQLERKLITPLIPRQFRCISLYGFSAPWPPYFLSGKISDGEGMQ